MKIFYLAKPTYGGWVTFTSHLVLSGKFPLFKISKKLEKSNRNFGYGVSYQNVPVDLLKNFGKDVVIAAIDKSGYFALDYVQDGATIIIHDPTELKEEVVKHLPRLKVICIRRTVQNLLKEKFGIDALFMYHPYSFPKCEKCLVEEKRSGGVSVSRIDFDKHTDIILDANEILKEPIEIYGKANTLYVYHKLGLERFNKSYKGSFKKSFSSIADILHGKEFMVDMSVIKNDGGGTQYTFLEAIHHGAVLILNKGWFEIDSNKLIPGFNCLVAKNGEELADLIKNTDKLSLEKIKENAKLILKEHEFNSFPEYEK